MQVKYNYPPMAKIAVCSKAVVLLLLIYSLILLLLFFGACVWSFFSYELLSILSSFAIILMRKRESWLRGCFPVVLRLLMLNGSLLFIGTNARIEDSAVTF